MTRKIPEAESAPSELTLNIESGRLIRRTLVILLAIEIAFVLGDLVFNYGKLVPVRSIQRLFNLGREDALGAWFASIQTLFVGLVLWAIYVKYRVQEEGSWRSRGWALLAAFFTYLAVDDGAKIHERVGTAFDKMSNRGIANIETIVSPFPTYTWQLIFMPFFGTMGCFILWFLWREFRDNSLRLLFMSALACYVFAVGLDFVEGLDQGYETVAALLNLQPKFTNHFGRVIEEFLELLGTTLFLVSFAIHFAAISSKVTVSFKQ